jgi:bacteriocin-like protein
MIGKPENMSTKNLFSKSLSKEAKDQEDVALLDGKVLTDEDLEHVVGGTTMYSTIETGRPVPSCFPHPVITF